MDIADAWRTLRTNPADAPRAGAHLETAGQSITTTITQECVVALPRASYSPDLVTITVTSLPSRCCWPRDRRRQSQQPGWPLSGSHDNGWPRRVHCH
jgi:hypothetical protein